MRKKRRWQRSADTSGGRRLVIRVVVTVALAFMTLGWIADSPAAACCVCRGGGCGDGFCADGIANSAACLNLCMIAGCPDNIFDSADVCAGGCDVAGPLPTVTPTRTVGTHTNTPTLTPSASAPTLTPSLTPTQGPPTLTPTPACCQEFKACSVVPPSGVCANGQPVLTGWVCVAANGSCALPTSTVTATLTPSITSTPTLTGTPTLSPTPSATSTQSATSTSTITPTPRATATPPHTFTPAICCQGGNICTDNGQQFPNGPVCTPLRGPSGQIIPLDPVQFARCEPTMREACQTFTPIPPFTPTVTATGTATQTPTVTVTLAVPTSIDPYKCYRIKDNQDPRFRKPDVRIVDRFGKTTSAVLKPFLLCNPAIETNLSEPAGTHGEQKHPEAHTVCFKIRDQNDPQRVPIPGELRVIFRDNPPEGAFTTIKPEFGKGDLICMPAAFVPPPPPTPKPCMQRTQCPTVEVCQEGICKDLRTPTPTPTI